MKNANPALLIGSVLFPILGFVLFFAKKDTDAETASVYLWSAVAGFVVGLLLII